MTAETTISKYVESWTAVVSLARSPIAWVPLVALAALKTILLLLLYFFWKAPVSSFMVPVIESVFGERAVHFPAHVLKLPEMYGTADMILMVAVGYVVIGWAVTMMVDRLEGNSIRASRYIVPTVFFIPALLVVGFVSVAVVQGLPAFVSHTNAAVASGRVRTLLGLMGLGASLFCKGILVFWPAYLVLSRGRVLAALARSWRTAQSWSWLAAMIVITAWALRAPFDYLISRPGALLQDSGPGMVFGVLIGSVIVEALQLFYLFGAATFVAMEQTGQE